MYFKLFQGIYSDTILLDPTIEEEALCYSIPSNSKESKNHGIMMQASLTQHNQVSELFFVGDIDFQTIENVMVLLNAASNDICLVVQQCLVKSVCKTLKHSKNNDNEKSDKN